MRLWGRDAQQQSLLRSQRCNTRYLPDAPFPPLLEVPTDLHDALTGADYVVIAVPSHGFRSTLQAVAPHLGAGIGRGHRLWAGIPPKLGKKSPMPVRRLEEPMP